MRTPAFLSDLPEQRRRLSFLQATGRGDDRTPDRMNARMTNILASLALFASLASAAPVKVIFDTDMETDCDDAGALAVLHTLADRDECEILATRDERA